MTIQILLCQPKNIPPSDIYSYSYPKKKFLKNWSELLRDTYNYLKLKTGQNIKKDDVEITAIKEGLFLLHFLYSPFGKKRQRFL